MAQPIQGYSSYSREALGLASAARGNGGMLRTSAPEVDNMADTGAESKFVNPQPFNNQNMMRQNVEQNTMAMVPQAEANAIQQVRNERRKASQQEFDAITLREEYKATALEALPHQNVSRMADPQTAAIVGRAVAQQKGLEPFANATMNPQMQLGANSNSLRV